MIGKTIQASINTFTHLNSNMKRRLILTSRFSTERKLYTPMSPLNEPRFNLLFAHSRYMKGQTLRANSFYVWIPAGCLAVNNFLTEWSLLTTSGFLALLFLGRLVKRWMMNATSVEILSLETTPDLNYFYVAVPLSPISYVFSRKYFENKDQEVPNDKV